MPSSSQQPHSPSDDRSMSPEVTLSIMTSPSKLIRSLLGRSNSKGIQSRLRLETSDESSQIRTNNKDSDECNEGNKETRVADAGHQFVILYSPWLRRGTEIFKVEFDPHFDEGEHFENAENMNQGQLQEVMKVLGAQSSADLSEAWIAKMFMKGMNAQRSNTTTRLRHQCSMLFGVSDSDMLCANLRKEKYRGRIGWVDNGHGSGTYSNVDVEILHKDYSGSFNIKTLFLNPVLMWVYIAIIRGPTAAKQSMSGIQPCPKADTMARKHNIRNTTPGAIAGSAVLCRWALSLDEHLQSVGTNTGINYGKDFEEYLELLITGLQQKKKSILNIFRVWDQVIFPNSDSTLVWQDLVRNGGMRMAMAMLAGDEVEDSGPKEES